MFFSSKSNTAAVLVGLRLAPRRSINLGGKLCIVCHVWLSVSSFGTMRRSFYMLNLFWRSVSLYGKQVSSQKLLQVFQAVFAKKLDFGNFEDVWELLRRDLLYESLRRELGWRFTARLQWLAEKELQLYSKSNTESVGVWARLGRRPMVIFDVGNWVLKENMFTSGWPVFK